MKTLQSIIVAGAAIFCQQFAVQSSVAEETSHFIPISQLYDASFDAVSIATNQSGKLIYHEIGNRELIRSAASEADITNLSGLSLVYNVTANDLEVVKGTNQTLVSTPITFSTGVSLGTTNGTTTQLFGGVYWGADTTPDGSIVAGEQNFPAEGRRPAFFSFQGQLQFVVPANDTNGPEIYVGNVSAQSNPPRGFGH